MFAEAVSERGLILVESFHVLDEGSSNGNQHPVVVALKEFRLHRRIQQGELSWNQKLPKEWRQ